MKKQKLNNAFKKKKKIHNNNTYLNKVYCVLILLAMRTATTNPQIAIIPAMTTGMMDFMINSGRITDIAAMPVPDLAVPQAAPRAKNKKKISRFNQSQES